MWAGDKPPEGYATAIGEAEGYSALGVAVDTTIVGGIDTVISTDRLRSMKEIELEERIEELEKLVNKLLLEVMPEYKV